MKGWEEAMIEIGMHDMKFTKNQLKKVKQTNKKQKATTAKFYATE